MAALIAGLKEVIDGQKIAEQINDVSCCEQ
jgi:hypothetical protein